MSDREDFQAARDAGLKARHETRLARAQEAECPCYKLLRGADGAVRHHPDCLNGPAHGWRDDVDEMHAHETREARAIRREVAEEIALAIMGIGDVEATHPTVYHGDGYFEGFLACARIAREIGSKETP